jgi:alkaline phosphatase
LRNLESTNEYWTSKAQSTIQEILGRKVNLNKAKNLILFLGDGMGFSTVAAARMYKGVEETELSFEKFPHLGLSKTYCVNKQTAGMKTP